METTFHINRLEFTPIKELQSEYNSASIIQKVFNYIQEKRKQGKGVVFDRHKNVDGSKRELFISGLRVVPAERRILFTLALLRSGRKPRVRGDNELELKDLQGEIVEETHFFVDISKNIPLVCVEYNFYGARGSDIEFYLRKIADDTLKIAKKTSLNLIMNSKIDEVIKNFENTLNFEFKISPSKIPELNKQTKGNYFSMMTGLGAKLQPQSLRINALFQTQGRKLEVKTKKNDEANSMIRDLLPKFKNKFFIENFQDFVLTYENLDGDKITENLMKSALSFDKDLKEQNYKLKVMYDVIKEDFTEKVNNVK